KIQGVDCDETSDPSTCKDVGGAIVLVGLAIAAVGWIVSLIEEIANGFDFDDSDEIARDTFNNSSCAAIQAMGDGTLVQLIEDMMDGFTGDDEEQAILKALNCLSCDRVQSVVTTIGRDNLLDEFNGDEWDQLMIRLKQCGLAGFGDWDDDATRTFLNG